MKVLTQRDEQRNIQLRKNIKTRMTTLVEPNADDHRNTNQHKWVQDPNG